MVESGIEDIGSSAGSQSDVNFKHFAKHAFTFKDKPALKRELRKLKGRLDASTEKVTELRVLLAMYNSPRDGSKSSRSVNWMLNGDRDYKR